MIFTELIGVCILVTQNNFKIMAPGQSNSTTFTKN